MSLEQLSDELIVEIAKQIARDLPDDEYYDHGSFLRGNRSLQHLVLSSRRLNSIVSPLLYRTFTQVWNKTAALPNFLRLVMQKPSIGSEVKKLVLLEIADTNYHNKSLDVSGYSLQDFQKCRAAMDSFGDLPFEKSEWLAGIGAGHWDAVVSLLLFFLPSLEEIDINYGGNSEWKFLGPTFKFMALNQSIQNLAFSLKNLRTFSIAHGDTKYGMRVGVILPVCILPSVTTVRAHTLEQEDHHRSNPPPAPSIERYQIQNLRVEHSCVGGNTMINLLRCFPSLRKLYYGHTGASVGLADFLPQKLGAAIAHLHDSLEELTLLDVGIDEMWGDEPFLPVGSLAAVKKLRCIGTEAPILFDSSNTQLADILPACLETLVLRCCDSDIYDQLRGILKAFSYGKQKFPVLKYIGVDVSLGEAFYDIGPDGKFEREEELKKYLEILAKRPEAPEREQSIQNFTKELEDIQARKPSEAEWMMWRECKKREEDLVAEFKELGIELQFNIREGDCWVVLHDFMVY